MSIIDENTKPGTFVEVYAEWWDGHLAWHSGYAFMALDRGEIVVGQTGDGAIPGRFREDPKNVRLATGDGIG